jgi:hypothetical protein
MKIDFNHLLIRLAVLVGVPVITALILLYSADQEQGHETDIGLGVAILAFFEVLLLGILIVGETVYLHLSGKPLKRNANLMVVGIFILFEVYVNMRLL